MLGGAGSWLASAGSAGASDVIPRMSSPIQSPRDLQNILIYFSPSLFFFFLTFSDVSGNKSAALEAGEAAGLSAALAWGWELEQRADLSLLTPPRGRGCRKHPC